MAQRSATTDVPLQRMFRYNGSVINEVSQQRVPGDNLVRCTFRGRELTKHWQVTGHGLSLSKIQIEGAEVVKHTSTSHVFGR